MCVHGQGSYSLVHQHSCTFTNVPFVHGLRMMLLCKLSDMWFSVHGMLSYKFSVSCARGCCSIGRRLDLSLSESSVRPMQFLRYMSIMLLFESSRSSASLKKLCCRLCCVRMAPVCHGKCSEAYSRYISLRPETWLLGRPANGSAITPAPPPPA